MSARASSNSLTVNLSQWNDAHTHEAAIDDFNPRFNDRSQLPIQTQTTLDNATLQLLRPVQWV